MSLVRPGALGVFRGAFGAPDASSRGPHRGSLTCPAGAAPFFCASHLGGPCRLLGAVLWLRRAFPLFCSSAWLALNAALTRSS